MIGVLSGAAEPDPARPRARSTPRSSTPTPKCGAPRSAPPPSRLGASSSRAWRSSSSTTTTSSVRDLAQRALASLSRQRVGVDPLVVTGCQSPCPRIARRHMARRRLEGLERVLGVNALFSTAYGNVGSSIYYALGLVAALALGLTPIVFLITGFFFLCTAATYAEATAMYPEAGGSSLLRAPRVQRVLVVLRRLGPDAQLRRDGRDLRVLRPALPRQRCSGRSCGTRPGDIIAGAIIIAILAAINVVGVKESAGLNIAARGRRLPHAGAAGDRRRRARARRQPGAAGRQRRARRRADVEELHPRDPDRHDRLHGHRDDLEHGRGGQGRDQDDPGRDQARARSPCSRSTSRCPRSRSSRCRSSRTRDGEYYTLLGLPEEEGGYAGDPIAGRGARNLDLGAVPDAGRDLRRHPRRHDPVPGHQRGPDRRLAARVLDGHPPPAARPAAPAAPEVPHAVDRDHRLRRRSRSSITLPGQAEFLGNLYAFGAMLSFTIAHWR